MFGWFTKKTELEGFCATLTLEMAARQLEGSENEDGFRRSLAVLLLHTAHHFWKSLTESRELKVYVRETCADVVIFETTVYVWSHVSLAMEQILEDAGLDEDDPLSQATTDSLHISMSFLKKYWPEFEPQTVLKTRLYPQSPLKSMEKYLGHLVTSFGARMPVERRQASAESSAGILAQLHLMTHVEPFTTAYLPGITESMKRMAMLVVQRRE